MKSFSINKMNLNLRQSVLFFTGAIVVLIGIGFPLKNKANEYEQKVNHQFQVTKRVEHISEAAALSPQASKAELVSLVRVLEEELAGLGLQKKLVHLLPEEEGVTFELAGIDLKGAMALLARIEKDRQAGKVVLMRLVPESDETALFLLQAKIQKK